MDKKELFKHYHGEFKEFAKELETKKWFKNGWTVSVGTNKHDQPYLTLRKKKWDPLIHFESWITGADLERGTIPVGFHFEAPKERTGIQRGKFYAYVLEHGKATIDQLDGFKLSPKSFQLLVKRGPFEEGKIRDAMAIEYDRIAPLGDIIDDAIEAVKE